MMCENGTCAAADEIEALDGSVQTTCENGICAAADEIEAFDGSVQEASEVIDFLSDSR